MKFSQLGLSCMVVEHSITAAAAEQLHCVPPDITTCLRELEGQLGVALSNRERNHLLVTPEDRPLYRHARRLLASADETAALFAGDQAYGAPRVGVLDAALANHLPWCLVRYCREPPGIGLYIRPEHLPLLERLPMEGELDPTVIDGPIEHLLLASRLAFRECLLQVTPADLPAPTPEDLVGLELYVFGHTCHYRRQVDRRLAGSAIQPRATLEIESCPSLFACIEADLGFACMPESFVVHRPSTRRGLHAEPAAGLDSNDIHFAWRKQ